MKSWIKNQNNSLMETWLKEIIKEKIQYKWKARFKELPKPRVRKILSTINRHWDKNKLKHLKEILHIYCIEEISMYF